MYNEPIFPDVDGWKGQINVENTAVPPELLLLIAFAIINQASIQFDASPRGKTMLNSSREKNEGTYRRGEGGGGPTDMSYYPEGGRGQREDNISDEGKKMKKRKKKKKAYSARWRR